MANSPKKSLRLRDLDHDQRRRVSIESALRCVLLVVVLLLLYAVWPFDTAPDAAWDVVVLGFAGVLFVSPAVLEGPVARPPMLRLLRPIARPSGRAGRPRKGEDRGVAGDDGHRRVARCGSAGRFARG